MPGQGIGSIYATMLSTGTAKTYHQVFKSSFYVFFNGDVYDIKNAIEKIQHSCLLLQIIFHAFISPMLRFIFFHPARIQDTATIENKTTSITGGIIRQFGSVGKTTNAYN